MTPDQADRLLAVMATTWPTPAMDHAKVTLWHQDLELMDAAKASRALDKLRVECKWLPSLSQFVEQYRAEVRAEQMHTPALPASTGDRIDPRQHIAAIKADIAERKARKPVAHRIEAKGRGRD